MAHCDSCHYSLWWMPPSIQNWQQRWGWGNVDSMVLSSQIRVQFSNKKRTRNAMRQQWPQAHVTVTRPSTSQSNEPQTKKTCIKWTIPALGPLSEAVAAGEYGPPLDFSTSSDEGEDEADLAHAHKKCDAPKTKGKRPDRRNATSVHVGTDADIGYIGRGVAIGPSTPQTNKGWRTDGTGPPVTLQAGILLTQLLAIFSDRHSTSLVALISYLQDPLKGHQPLSGKTDMRALIADLLILETSAHANDLLYMCKLIQLVLNVDQIRLDFTAEGGKRNPGVGGIAADYDQPIRTFQHWHTCGSRLLHLCCAGGMHMLLIIACLGLRPALTNSYREAVKDINSLADAIHEVSEGKWKPLVHRLIGGIHYLQSTPIPALEHYRFTRGNDEFTFTDTKKSDSVLQSVQTNLFTLPSRAPDWNFDHSKPWAPNFRQRKSIQPAEVVIIRTALKLERTSVLPFSKGQQKEWTEQQRILTGNSVVPNNFNEFRDKLTDMHKTGTCPPGQYIDLDSDIMEGQAFKYGPRYIFILIFLTRKTLVIEDSTGLKVLTLMTMPDDMIDRFDNGFDNIDAILPNEFCWDDSTREGYSYSCFAYTWYYRSSEKGHGSPAGAHSHNLHKGVKVNHQQRTPYSSINTVQKAMEFETISEVFSEAFDFQRVNFQHANPEAFEEVRPFADALPLNSASPCYPFAGYMLNFRVVTDAHKDALDAKWCLIIFVKRGFGAELCLYELGVKVKGKTGNMLAFASRWTTHFNTHFQGQRCTLVLHTDKEGDDWAEDTGGWADHVARHVRRYARD
ncbi:hypothetical protein DFH07DRAFT_939066 [Mycena maculata]|uniref:Uncharacterized protein n=1 Tax=Mycena maculata TaxID=230809 RepID=A0AAD7JGX6_9AGAR|nr:hypothetical protein DFH07DRAFT_939066 [Mycena maculata]